MNLQNYRKNIWKIWQISDYLKRMGFLRQKLSQLNVNCSNLGLPDIPWNAKTATISPNFQSHLINLTASRLSPAKRNKFLFLNQSISNWSIGHIYIFQYLLPFNPSISSIDSIDQFDWIRLSLTCVIFDNQNFQLSLIKFSFRARELKPKR